MQWSIKKYFLEPYAASSGVGSPFISTSQIKMFKHVMLIKSNISWDVKLEISL